MLRKLGGWGGWTVLAVHEYVLGRRLGEHGGWEGKV